MITSQDVADAASRFTSDELYEWMLRSLHEAVDPLADMADVELARVADGADPPPFRVWLTPPLARLQLRLRALLAEQEAAI
jgi:hypothetical protein